MSFDDTGRELDPYIFKIEENRDLTINEYKPYEKSMSALLGSGVVELLFKKSQNLIWRKTRYQQQYREMRWFSSAAYDPPVHSYMATSYMPALIEVVALRQELKKEPDLRWPEEISDFSYIEDVDNKNARDLSAFCIMLFNKQYGIISDIPTWNEVRVLARPDGKMSIGYQNGGRNSEVKYRCMEKNYEAMIDNAIDRPIKIRHNLVKSQSL